MSTRPAVGIVTIGQSPRTDVVPDIAARLAPGTVLVERGALDEAEPAELARLAPRPGEDLLVTRLRDGTEVTLAEARLMPLVRAAVDHVTERGAMIVAVLCTGPLAPVPCPVPLLLPGELVKDLVATAASGARLGVVVPAPGQIASARADWSAAAEAVLALAASPYGSPEALRGAATTLAAWRPDLVVLDCLGFDGAMQQMVAELAGVPVILPRTVLAEAISLRVVSLPVADCDTPRVRCPGAGLDQLLEAQQEGGPLGAGVAFGLYVLDPQTGISHAAGMMVVTLTGDKVCVMTGFDTSPLPHFGLPRTLPG